MQTIQIPAMYEVTTYNAGGMHDNHICFYTDNQVAATFANNMAKLKNWPFTVRQIQAKTITVLEAGENPYEITEQQKAMQLVQELQSMLSKLDPAIAASIISKFK